MTTRNSFQLASGLLLLAGALALPVVSSVARSIAPDEIAAATSPDILHHWSGDTAVASVSADPAPAILHHWPTSETASTDADADILHHWPTSKREMSQLDPSILHHWP